MVATVHSLHPTQAADALVDASQAVTLTPLTPEAEAALDHRGGVTLIRFPARIGREFRAPGLLGNLLGFAERRGTRPPNNDLYLIDEESVKHISRDHMQIELRKSGYWITDRGSACGTVVGDAYIGGNRRKDSAPIHDGSVVIVGSPASPFVFRFNVGMLG